MRGLAELRPSYARFLDLDGGEEAFHRMDRGEVLRSVVVI